jgi:glycosyltransferase involved in cell wall biosynthesis
MFVLFLGIGSSPHVYRLAAAVRARGHRVGIVSEDKFGPFPEIGDLPLYLLPSNASFARRALVLRRLLAELEPDVLHAHVINVGGYLGTASGFHPHVLSVWGSDVLIAPQRGAVHRLRTMLTLRAADWLLSPSRTTQQAMDTLGRGPAHNDIVQWGVDLRHFRPAAAAPAAPVVLSVRALQPLYNQDVMLAAWPAVLAAHPAAELHLVRYLPDAAFERALRAQIERLGIGASVRFVDGFGYAALPGALHAAAAVVSIPSSDGTPVSVLEAMACGTPVIVSDLPSLRDWVREGESGLLCPPRDAAQLAAQLQRALALPAGERTRMGAAARGVIAARGDREQALAGLEDIYARAMAERRGGYVRTLRNVLIP